MLLSTDAGVRGAVGITLSDLDVLQAAARITVPVELWVQWDDERVPREQGLALFDALGSAGKTLHASPGGHGGLPSAEAEASARFFARHLG